MDSNEIKRGNILNINLGEQKGSIQGGIRPCIVISNDMCNKFSPVITVIPLSSRVSKNNIPTHVLVTAEESGLYKDSVALCEQILTINKTDILNKITELDSKLMYEITNAAMKQLSCFMFVNNNSFVMA